MADRLGEIFTWQERFNTRVREERHLEFSSGEWIQREAIALMVELGEVMEEVRYKWRKNPHGKRTLLLPSRWWERDPAILLTPALK